MLIPTEVGCDKRKLGACVIAIFLCGMCYIMTVTNFQDGSWLSYQTANVSSVFLSHKTTRIGLKTKNKIVDFGEALNASHLNRHSYGTARSDLKSLVSYTEKTIRQTSESVRSVAW